MVDAAPFRLRAQGLQDTGNPVLDSMANIVAAAFSQSRPATADIEGFIEAVHDAVRKVADEEPGGLIRAGGWHRSEGDGGDEPSDGWEVADRPDVEKAEFGSGEAGQDEADQAESEETDAEGDGPYDPVIEAHSDGRRESRPEPSRDDSPRREASWLKGREERARARPRTAGDAAGQIAETFVGKAVSKIAGSTAGEAASRAAGKAAKRMADRAVGKLAERAVRKITGDAARTRPR